MMTGRCVALACALFGLDRPGHHIVTPMALHAWAMNVTILAEVRVAAAAFIAAGHELIVHAVRAWHGSQQTRP